VCGEPSRNKSVDLCNRHYLRWRRYGDPLAGGRERSKEWFGDVALSDHGLVWIGRMSGGDKREYGRFSRTSVHRLAYEHFIGPIPKGFIVDHQPGCPKICVTPEHLLTMSVSDHAKLGWQRGELDGGWSVRPHG
jgi:hypothetical protein